MCPVALCEGGRCDLRRFKKRVGERSWAMEGPMRGVGVPQICKYMCLRECMKGEKYYLCI